MNNLRIVYELIDAINGVINKVRIDGFSDEAITINLELF